MSCNTAPGQGGFFELENGEELFLTTKCNLFRRNSKYRIEPTT